MTMRGRLKQAGVPEDLHDEALKSLAMGRNRAIPVAIVGLFAPIVMFLALYVFRVVSPKDNALPKWLSWYDNNVSINGDGWGTRYADGSFANFYDEAAIATAGAVAMSYSDPNYGGDAYYAKDSHPRSQTARFIWLGIRNRASKMAMDRGAVIDSNDKRDIWGEPNPGRSKPGVFAMRQSGYWQVKGASTVFFGLLSMNFNYGFKINNVDSEPGSKAMCIWYPFAFKSAKG